MTASNKRTHPPVQRAWWKESTVYQIYPASFRDTTGTGTGDIPGITSKLDYIKQLGANIVWLSPILDSPQVDMGYDISNYKDIYPPYGTMADHDALIKGLHDRGMKYVMDLVVNHTSDQHEWFQQSRSSKDNPYRDWYMWRPARTDENGNRMPPNNWEAAFSGSVWEWDETTQEYYLHLFAKEQPDLNWENPKVVDAVHDIIRFWLERGVDGFRMDVINFISKEPGLPDAEARKPGFLQGGIEFFAKGPRLHEFLNGIGKILKEYDAFSVGEMPGVHEEQEILKAVQPERNELAMVFNFETVDMDHGPHSKWDPVPFEPAKLRNIVNKWQTFMLENEGWNAVFLENHDQGRTVSRYASDAPHQRTISAKMIAAHQALQCGTLFVYQGQELAQADLPREWDMDKYRDIEALNHWETVLRDYPDDKAKQKMYRDHYRLTGRDSARTPMQWTDGKYAGFSPESKDVTTWMDVHPDYETWNAEKIVADKNSSYHYWSKLLELRKKEKDIFVYGDFEMLDKENKFPDVIAYVRTEDNDQGQGNKKAVSISSFSGEETWWEIPEQHKDLLFDDQGKLRTDGAVIQDLRNYSDLNEIKVEGGKYLVKLRPYECIVALI